MKDDSAILELYYKIQEEHETSPKYKTIQRKVVRLRDELDNDLNPEQRNLVDQIMSLKNEMASIECQEYFSERVYTCNSNYVRGLLPR